MAPSDPSSVTGPGTNSSSSSTATPSAPHSTLPSTSTLYSPVAPPGSSYSLSAGNVPPIHPAPPLPSTGSNVSNNATATLFPPSFASRTTHKQLPSVPGLAGPHSLSDQGTVGDYALHHLLNSFIAQADQKLNQCLVEPLDVEPDIETICGQGVDPKFDQLISALGHMARLKPKPLVDIFFIWRKEKSDELSQARSDLFDFQQAAKPGADLSLRSKPLPVPPAAYPAYMAKRIATAERKSVASIYLLCRVLISIISQCKSDKPTYRMLDRVEDVIYVQLKQVDSDTIEQSKLRRANWVMFGRVLGVISELRLKQVLAQFLLDFRSLISSGSSSIKHAERDNDARFQFLLRGMKFLRISIPSDGDWSTACDCLSDFAQLMMEVPWHNSRHACAHSLRDLLLPLVTKVGPSLVSFPSWLSFLKVVTPWAFSQLPKPKHWGPAFMLCSVLYCLSPRDYFLSNWSNLVSSAQGRLKDRPFRPVALKGLCWLVWRYLYRLEDKDGEGRVAELVRLLFHSNKKPIFSTETAVAEPLVQLIRIIGHKLPELCFREIIFPLMNSDAFMSSNPPVRADQLDPDRMVIGIRAFLAVISDVEEGTTPPFPTEFDDEADKDETIRLPSSLSFRRNRETKLKRTVTLNRDRLSRAVNTSNLPEFIRESHEKFCRILGQITIICDDAFGGQAVLNELFSSTTPKTPMADAFGFSRRGDDHTGQGDSLRQGFFDLLHVAVQALPRCLSTQIPLKPLVNLLCTGTAHVQSTIASSSAQSLKSIARQGYAHDVTVGFSQFIFNFDDRYSIMSDGGMLGVEHIENTLRLYVELLEIWIEEIRMKQAATEKGSLSGPLESTTTWQRVDEIESHGLFFLCSPSRRVRTHAVTVLKLIPEFDDALSNRAGNRRMLEVLQSDMRDVINIQDDKLTLAERTRLVHGSKGANKSTFIELCTSDLPYETTLWFKIYPAVVKASFERCPPVCAMTRSIVCNRLTQMQPTITVLSDGQRTVTYPGHEAGKAGLRVMTVDSDVVIEQWKVYLIFACSTMTNGGWVSSVNPQGLQAHPSGPAPSHQHHFQEYSHSRKPSSRSGTTTTTALPDKINSASDLFSKLMPLLTAPSVPIREAVVAGLGAINVSLYKSLLAALKPAVMLCHEESKSRGPQHQRTPSAIQRQKVTDILRTEVTHLYTLTCHFLSDPDVTADEWVVDNVVSYMKSIMKFLSESQIQSQSAYLRLRLHFCGLAEALYEGIRKTSDPMRYLSFESRKAVFILLEDWCGFSPHEERNREDRRDRTGAHDNNQFGIGTAAMEIEKRNVRTAALSAMASLCAGPIQVVLPTRATLKFDVKRMVDWIERVFETVSDRTHLIGQRALYNLMVNNPTHAALIDLVTERCYLTTNGKSISSYISVLQKVLEHQKELIIAERGDGSILPKPDPPSSLLNPLGPPFWKVACVGLFLLGNESVSVRSPALAFLRELDGGADRDSPLVRLSAAVADRTRSVYRNAQLEVSRQMAQAHDEYVLYVVSEFTRCFRLLKSDLFKSVLVGAMLPWIEAVHLHVEADGRPSAGAWLVLTNLYEMTIRNNSALPAEMQALWQGLSSNTGNVQMILDFSLQLCLSKREQNFMEHARQIVVYVAGTMAGASVRDYLLSQISPRMMVPGERIDFKKLGISNDGVIPFPYLANLDAALPVGSHNSPPFSVGHICMVLLVDLMVWPDRIVQPSQVAQLLQIVVILWDHHVNIFREQARELLVHLLHQLHRYQQRNGTEEETAGFGASDQLVQLILRSDPAVDWGYDDCNGSTKPDSPGPTNNKANGTQTVFENATTSADFGSKLPPFQELLSPGRPTPADLRVPPPLAFIALQCVFIFSKLSPMVQQEWCKLCLEWATSCSVRHLACRSFQLFRVLFTSSSEPVFHTDMLADMLARLSNTIADEDGVVVFSREILSTLTAVIRALSEEQVARHPQLFWAVCACLGTVHESEYVEALAMLDAFLDKKGLTEDRLDTLEQCRPATFDVRFEGIQKLVYSGLRSSVTFEKSVEIVGKLCKLPSHALIGDDTRLLYATLAHMPVFLRSFEQREEAFRCRQVAFELADVSSKSDLVQMAAVLSGFPAGFYNAPADFIRAVVAAIKDHFLPAQNLNCLIFLLGLLPIKTRWVKVGIMDVLGALIPQIDIRAPDISEKGADLISPLLRLLQTEYCPQALAVLDHMMGMATCSPLDQQHLRMSMVGHYASRQTRKEYDCTVSLYGIPDESGWSVPMPGQVRGVVQANVQAVFGTCLLDGQREEEEEQVGMEERQVGDVEDRSGNGGRDAGANDDYYDNRKEVAARSRGQANGSVGTVATAGIVADEPLVNMTHQMEHDDDFAHLDFDSTMVLPTAMAEELSSGPLPIHDLSDMPTRPIPASPGGDYHDTSEIDLDAADFDDSGVPFRTFVDHSASEVRPDPEAPNPLETRSRLAKAQLAAPPAAGGGASRSTSTTRQTTSRVGTSRHNSSSRRGSDLYFPHQQQQPPPVSAPAPVALARSDNDLVAKFRSLDYFFEDDDEDEVDHADGGVSGPGSQSMGYVVGGLPNHYGASSGMSSFNQGPYGNQYGTHYGSIAEETEPSEMDLTKMSHLSHINEHTNEDEDDGLIDMDDGIALPSEQIYDQKTAPMIRNTLARNASLSSPQSTIIDLKSPPNPFAPMSFANAQVAISGQPQFLAQGSAASSAPRPGLLRAATMATPGMGSGPGPGTGGASTPIPVPVSGANNLARRGNLSTSVSSSRLNLLSSTPGNGNPVVPFSFPDSMFAATKTAGNSNSSNNNGVSRTPTNPTISTAVSSSEPSLMSPMSINSPATGLSGSSIGLGMSSMAPVNFESPTPWAAASRSHSPPRQPQSSLSGAASTRNAFMPRAPTGMGNSGSFANLDAVLQPGCEIVMEDRFDDFASDIGLMGFGSPGPVLVSPEGDDSIAFEMRPGAECGGADSSSHSIDEKAGQSSRGLNLSIVSQQPQQHPLQAQPQQHQSGQVQHPPHHTEPSNAPHVTGTPSSSHRQHQSHHRPYPTQHSAVSSHSAHSAHSAPSLPRKSSESNTRTPAIRAIVPNLPPPPLTSSSAIFPTSASVGSTMSSPAVNTPLSTTLSTTTSPLDGFIPRASQRLRVGMRRLTGGGGGNGAVNGTTSNDRDGEGGEKERNLEPSRDRDRDREQTRERERERRKDKMDGLRAVLGRGGSRVRTGTNSTAAPTLAVLTDFGGSNGSGGGGGGSNGGSGGGTGQQLGSSAGSGVGLAGSASGSASTNIGAHNTGSIINQNSTSPFGSNPKGLPAVPPIPSVHQSLINLNLNTIDRSVSLSRASTAAAKSREPSRSRDRRAAAGAGIRSGNGGGGGGSGADGKNGLGLSAPSLGSSFGTSYGQTSENEYPRSADA